MCFVNNNFLKLGRVKNLKGHKRSHVLFMT